MNFPDRVLTVDERVVRHFHPHWKILVPAALWMITIVAGLITLLVIINDINFIVLLVLSLCSLGAFLVLSFRPWLSWKTTHYVFTNERLIIRRGIMTRAGRDLPLDRINQVSFNQGIIDRVLGMGTLTIKASGEGGRIELADIPNVEKVHRVLYELLETDRDSHTFDDGDRDSSR